MHCRSCNYALWNIKARQCPECGTDFKPSEFEFVLNSVRFQCPHCEQDYYGTSERGHLEPPEFDCVGCSARVHMDEMLLLPTEGVTEKQTKPESNPWLERDTTSRVGAWWKTCVRAMFSPNRLGACTPPESSLWDAGTFFVLTQILVAVATFLPLVLFIIPVAAMAAGQAGGGAMPALTAMAVGMGGIGVGGIVTAIFGSVLWVLSAHAVLKLTPGPDAGINVSFHAIWYGSGANVMTAVPCVGSYFGWIWWIVSSTVYFKSAHGVSAWRASLAVLLLPVLLVVGGTLAYTALIVTSINAATAQISTMNVTTSGIERIGLAMVMRSEMFADAPNAEFAGEHAMHLLTEASLEPSDFIASGYATRQSDVPVGRMYDLSTFRSMTIERQSLELQAAEASLGASPIAHRLGDYVFTQHGIDLRVPADPGLWIVILSPNPGVEGQPPIMIREVALVDGTTDVIVEDGFDEALAEQNALRAELGLPALPHPDTVTHDAPARDE